MGTKLGNLHIRNATVEEVAPLLPGAIVGQWADGFVSAYSEEYQWGSAEQAGRKLSRKLPAATVLTAAIFDSDVVNFEVYTAGKRLTAHLLNPYEGINRAGNPKVFCEALGLPPEDEKRLRTLWKKGDAEEQLELTGALLGLPLCHDPAYMPKEPARRDAQTVDTWIAERPDPPKLRLKSVTKAELIQEEGGRLFRNNHSKYWGNTEQSGFFFFQDIQDGWLSNDVWVYQYTSEKPLVCVEKVDCPLTDKRMHNVGGPVCYVLAPERVLFGNTLFREVKYFKEGNPPGMPPEGYGMQLCYDSAGQLRLPLDLEGHVLYIRSMPDGGITTVTAERECWGDPFRNILSRYEKDGTCLYQKELPGKSLDDAYIWLKDGFLTDGAQRDTLFLDWEGNELFHWKTTPPDYSRYCCMTGNDILFLTCDNRSLFISRWDQKGNELARSPVLADYVAIPEDVKDAGDGKHIFASCTSVNSNDRCLLLLDRETLEIVWRQVRRDEADWRLADGAGRYWVQVGETVLEAYDLAENLVSRHRLKGDIIHTKLDRSGRLLAYTHHYNANTLRVYRIS